MQLAGIFSEESQTAQIALMLEWRLWSGLFGGFTVKTNGSLTVIDFEGHGIEGCEGDVQRRRHGCGHGDDLCRWRTATRRFRCAKEYSSKVQSGELEFGSPMRLGDDKAMSLVVSEHFSPPSLLGLFKDHAADMPNGITLIFSKRSAKEQGSALVVVTPLANGCLGVHLMSYCRPDE